MFNKEQYWERRKNNVRGQDDLLQPRVARWTEEDHKASKCAGEDIGKERLSGVEMRMTRQGLVAYPRRVRRQRVVDRDFTAPNFKYRIHREKAPFSGHIRRAPLKQSLSYSPEQTNHQRMLARRGK